MNYAQDFVGWMLFLVSLTIPLLSDTVRKDQTLLLACWFAIFLHQAAAIINCYLFILPGCDGDALAMHNAAQYFGTRPHLDTMPYVKFLRAIYDAIGSSQFLGSQLSVCSHALSLLLFIDLCKLSKTRVSPAWLVLLFNCLPVSIINTSTTLRESYQVLAVLCVGWAITSIKQKTNTTRAYLVLATGLVLLLNLHRGLAFYGMAMMLVSYLQLARNLPSVLVSLALVFGLLAGGASLGSLGQQDSGPSRTNTSAVSDLELAASYRDYNTGGRAGYKAKIDTSNPINFIFSVFVCLFLYMFAPLPWMITGLPDLYALVESLFRMFLVAGTIYNLRNAKGNQRSTLIFLAILFWSLELLWAVGTSNWGQAIRHRAVAYSFLVILGGDWWLDRFLSGAKRSVLLPSPALDSNSIKLETHPGR